MDKKIGAIILAAGKGKRMKLSNMNKAVFPLAGKPMLLYTVERLKKMDINPIMVVIGFAKKSITDLLKDNVIYAIQTRRLGTAHAVQCALRQLKVSINNVLVLGGDDSAFLTEETIKKLIQEHFSTNADLTFLTIDLDNPFGLGRVIRDENNSVLAIVEEKDALDRQKKIKEINSASYVFKTEFLKKYLPMVKKNIITGEYYLTDLVELALVNNKKVEAVRGGKIPWRGVNTKEELLEAQRLFPYIK